MAPTARGSKGFPNLADSDWLGTVARTTIVKEHHQRPQGMMPPMAAAVGTAEDVKNVATTCSACRAARTTRRPAGKAKFAACAACHGNEGKGNRGPGGAQPDRQDLAAWLGRASHHQHGQQRQVST
jgi:cytochrome c oxidase cbb3-type subunit 3